MQLNSWYRLTTEAGDISIVYHCVNPTTGATGFASAVPGVPFIEMDELISSDRLEPVEIVPTEKYQAERTDHAQLVLVAGRLVASNVEVPPSDKAIIQGVLNRRAAAFSDTHQALV